VGRISCSCHSWTIILSSLSLIIIPGCLQDFFSGARACFLQRDFFQSSVGISSSNERPRVTSATLTWQALFHFFWVIWIKSRVLGIPECKPSWPLKASHPSRILMLMRPVSPKLILMWWIILDIALMWFLVLVWSPYREGILKQGIDVNQISILIKK